MSQVFECPQCHEEVRPDHLACYSCGMTAETRPVVVTGEHQNHISETLGSVEDAISVVINLQMNCSNQHQEDLLDDLMEKLQNAKYFANLIHKEFWKPSEE